MKKLVVFDLDGTLTESKQEVDVEMVELLGKLLAVKKVAITGGASFEQFFKQIVTKLNYPNLLGNLILFPTNGAFCYRFEEGEWKEKYILKLTGEEKEKIFGAFEKVFKEINYINPKITYGEVLDDRDSQITYSALGQKAPIEERIKWSQSGEDRRKEIIEGLKKYLSDYEIVLAGVTSIDVIRKGVDKSLAIYVAMKILGLNKEDVLFVGDALYEGGNDFLAIKSGVETKKVSGLGETKELINRLLAD